MPLPPFRRRPYQSDAVAIVLNSAVADGYVRVVTHKVRDADAAHHRVLRIAFHCAAVNDQRIRRRNVDLRDIAVGR